MLCSVADKTTMNEKYKELVNKFKTSGSQEAVCKEIIELCKNCQSSSPIMCIELCPIWKLKRESRDIFEAIAKKPSPTLLINISKNNRRLKILEALTKKPYSLKELRCELKEMGCYTSLNTLRNCYINPLLDVRLIKKEKGSYELTPMGKNISDVLIKSQIKTLPLRSKAYEEKVLTALLLEPKTYEELVKTVPRSALSRSLKRLQSKGFIIKSNFLGHIFYYRAKRKPTRKLSPTEMKIFRALPKEGISVKNLSEKVGINVRSIYKHLRRLKYKRHIKKEKKPALYELTDEGRRLAQSLKMIFNYYPNLEI